MPPPLDRHARGSRHPLGADPSMLTFQDVQEAARRLAGRIHRTPVITSRSFDEAVGIG